MKYANQFFAKLLKHTLLCLASVSITTCLLAQAPVAAQAPIAETLIPLETGMGHIDDITPIQFQALDFLLSSNDSLVFIKKNIPPGKAAPQTDAHSGEFDEVAVDPSEAENKQALEEARQMLNGERDIRLTADFSLDYYLSESECFKTSLIYDTVGVKLPRYNEIQLPSGATVKIQEVTSDARLTALRLINMQQFTSFKIQKELAKQLIDTLGKNRTLRVTFRCRIIPKSQTLDQVSGWLVPTTVMKVRALGYNFQVLRDYSAEGLVNLPAELMQASAFASYERSKVDGDFADQFANKVLAAKDGRTYIFRKDGRVQHSDDVRYDLGVEIALNEVANLPHIGKWYISKNKVIILGSGVEVLTLSPIEGGLRFNDIPHFFKSSIVLDGNKVSYRPKK